MLFKKRPQQVAPQKGAPTATVFVDKRAEIPATDDVLAAIDAAMEQKVSTDSGSGPSCCICSCAENEV